ncbi:hypothetical protein ACNKHO_16460 [Shigella flexneri]
MPFFPGCRSAKGKLAFISQSAAVSNTVLDWARQREMGSPSSPWATRGREVDELLDFLARDEQNQRYPALPEHLSDARRFVSA